MFLNPCPICGDIPELGYVCGEYFVSTEHYSCPCCGVFFDEMHSSEQTMIDFWDKRISIFKENYYD